MGRGSIRKPKGFASWAVASTLGFAALPAAAQAPVPAGAQFQVNSYTTADQQFPSVAADADGDFVVVWQSWNSEGLSIQGQRYASDGSTQGAQFQVNTDTIFPQQFPSVAMHSDGDFVVVWQRYKSFGTDTSGNSIQGQRYASTGLPKGAQFQVNTYTTNEQVHPRVAAATTGDFIVVWWSTGSFGTDTSSYSIQGQRYASDGSAQGAQFQVNTYTTSHQRGPSVAADAAGDFVVVWTSYGSSGTDTLAGSIQGQRYASDGATLGAEFQVNTETLFVQRNPAVAADAAGDFVVVWDSNRSYNGTDHSDLSIQGQRYASNGSTQGAQFQVNTYTPFNQEIPFVAVDSDGDFVVVWTSYRSAGTDTSHFSLQGQRYAPNGSTQGAEFQVNTYTTYAQTHSSVAADADGDFVVVWDNRGSFATDTSGYSIQGQRYSMAAAAPPVPAMSTATRFAVVAALLLGAAYALRRRG